MNKIFHSNVCKVLSNSVAILAPYILYVFLSQKRLHLHHIEIMKALIFIEILLCNILLNIIRNVGNLAICALSNLHRTSHYSVIFNIKTLITSIHIFANVTFYQILSGPDVLVMSKCLWHSGPQTSWLYQSNYPQFFDWIIKQNRFLDFA